MIANIALTVALVFVASVCVILFLANMQLTARRKLLMTEDVVALAEHLMSEREYQRAFEALDIAKKSHRCLEKCLLLYGTLSVKTGNYLEGLHYCKEVVQANQCFSRALDCTAEAYLQLKDPNRARSEFRRSLHCNPSDSYALLGLSSLHLEQKEYQSVIELLLPFERKYVDVVRSLKPSSHASSLAASFADEEKDATVPAFFLYAHEEKLAVEILYNLASAQSGSKHVAAAISLLHDIITAVPNHVKAYKLLHELLTNENQHEKALAIARSLAGHLPLSSSGHALMGKSLLELRRAPEAVTTLQVAVMVEQEASSNIRLLYSLGAALETVGEFSEAANVLTKATEILARDHSLVLHSAQHRLGDSSATVIDTTYQTGHHSSPAIDVETMRLIYGTLGRVQSRLGKWHAAYVALLRSVGFCARCEGQGEVWMALGTAQRKLGLYQDSQRSFMEASFYLEVEAAALQELAKPRETDSTPILLESNSHTEKISSQTGVASQSRSEEASSPVQQKVVEEHKVVENVSGHTPSHARTDNASDRKSSQEEAHTETFVEPVVVNRSRETDKLPVVSEHIGDAFVSVPAVVTSPVADSVPPIVVAPVADITPATDSVAAAHVTEIATVVVESEVSAPVQEEGQEEAYVEPVSPVEDAESASATVHPDIPTEPVKEQVVVEEEQEVQIESQTATETDAVPAPAVVDEVKDEEEKVADEIVAATAAVTVVDEIAPPAESSEEQKEVQTPSVESIPADEEAVSSTETPQEIAEAVATEAHEAAPVGAAGDTEADVAAGATETPSQVEKEEEHPEPASEEREESNEVEPSSSSPRHAISSSLAISIVHTDSEEENEREGVAPTTAAQNEKEVEQVVSEGESTEVSPTYTAGTSVSVVAVESRDDGVNEAAGIQSEGAESSLITQESTTAVATEESTTAAVSQGESATVTVTDEPTAVVATDIATVAVVSDSPGPSALATSTTQDAAPPATATETVAAPAKPTPNPAAVRAASQYITLATAYMGRGLAEMAVKQLQKAVKKAPDYADVYILRGTALIELGQWVEAAEDFVKVATELDKGNATAYENAALIGIQLRQAGQLENAIKILLPLYRFNSSDAQVSQPLALSLAAVQGQEELALEVLSRTDTRVRRALGIATAAAGIPPSPGEGSDGNETSTAADERPLTAQSVHMLAKLYEKTNRSELAEQLWVEAIDKKLSTWADLGDLQQRQERYADAAKSFEREIEVIMEPYRPSPPVSIHENKTDAAVVAVSDNDTHAGGSSETTPKAEAIEGLTSEGSTAAVTEEASPVAATHAEVEPPIPHRSSSPFSRGRRGGDFTHKPHTPAVEDRVSAPAPKVPSAMEKRRLAILHYKLGALYNKHLSDMSKAAGHYEAAMDYGLEDKEMRRFFAAYAKMKAQAEGRALPDVVVDENITESSSSFAATSNATAAVALDGNETLAAYNVSEGSVVPLAIGNSSENSTTNVVQHVHTLSNEQLQLLEEGREARLAAAEAGRISNGVAKRAAFNRNRWLVWGNVEQKQLNAKFPHRRKEKASIGTKRMGDAGMGGGGTSDADLSGLASSLGLPSMAPEEEKVSAFESQMRQQEAAQEEEEMLEQAARDRFTQATMGTHGAFHGGLDEDYSDQMGDSGSGGRAGLEDFGDISALLGSLGGANQR